jgi:3-oxoacyl-[acyl-carrier-protein] synthase II
VTAAAVVTGIGVVGPPAGAAADWFDPRTALGARGYKYLPPACQYLLAAGRLAVADGGRLDGVPAERRAAFVATNTGLEHLFADMDATVTGGTADALSPALAPFFAVNVLGTRLVAEHAVNGPFVTLTSPRVAGIEAIGAGARAMAAGRCDAWITATMEHPVGAPASGGAVALILEDPAVAAARGARVHGSCRATALLAPPSVLRTTDGRRRLVEAMRGLVGVGVDVELFGDGSSTEDAVVAALLQVPAGAVRREPAGPGCLTPLRRVATLFTDPGTAGARLVLAVTEEGHIGAACLTMAQPTAGRSG